MSFLGYMSSLSSTHKTSCTACDRHIHTYTHIWAWVYTYVHHARGWLCICHWFLDIRQWHPLLRDFLEMRTSPFIRRFAQSQLHWEVYKITSEMRATPYSGHHHAWSQLHREVYEITTEMRTSLLYIIIRTLCILPATYIGIHTKTTCDIKIAPLIRAY